MTSREKNHLSAAALAKKHNITTEDMLLRLAGKQFIEKKGESWTLTNEGKTVGGRSITGKQLGDYIVWPDDLELDAVTEKLLTVPAMANHFSLDKEIMIELLENIEWLYKVPNGYLLLPKGMDADGVEGHDLKSDQLYVRWPQSVLDNEELSSMVKSQGGMVHEKQSAIDLREGIIRQKCSFEFRTLDGHFVATETEAVVDNFLFQHQLVHMYRAAHNDSPEIISTFFLPGRNLFIDVFDSGAYSKETHRRREYYQRNGIKVVELTTKDIDNLMHKLGDAIF